MTFNDLLVKDSIDPKTVRMLRHRPKEQKLNKELPMLAGIKPAVFNAYQQTQAPKVERALEALKGVGYVGSFIRHGAGKALFVGLYRIKGSQALTHDALLAIPHYKELVEDWGFRGMDRTRPTILWFDLVCTDFCAEWSGRLVVKWPLPEIQWSLPATHDYRVAAILEESGLTVMPDWREIDLPWDYLTQLPQQWRAELQRWRVIYYIFDKSDRKGYVGSACGVDNLLGRWKSYADHGHGGNTLLRKRDPKRFRFSILERVSPDMKQREVVQLERSWKLRLHTHHPDGLNDN
jgi:hypothetical protein